MFLQCSESTLTACDRRTCSGPCQRRLCWGDELQQKPEGWQELIWHRDRRRDPGSWSSLTTFAWAYASAPCVDSWSQRSFPTFFSTFASCSHCPKLLPLSLELPVEFSVFTASFFNLANSCWTPALPEAQSWALSCYCLWETFSSLYLFSLLYVRVVIIDLGFWFLSYRH